MGKRKHNGYRQWVIDSEGRKMLGLYTFSGKFIKWLKQNKYSEQDRNIYPPGVKVSLQSTEKDELCWPGRISEFEVQSKLFNEITLAGIYIRGEVKTKLRRCRFDLVVYDIERNPIAIVEVKVKKVTKKQTRVHKNRKRNLDKQIDKYSVYDVPVIICNGIHDIERTIQSVYEICDPYYNQLVSVKP